MISIRIAHQDKQPAHECRSNHPTLNPLVCSAALCCVLRRVEHYAPCFCLPSLGRRGITCACSRLAASCGSVEGGRGGQLLALEGRRIAVAIGSFIGKSNGVEKKHFTPLLQYRQAEHTARVCPCALNLKMVSFRVSLEECPGCITWRLTVTYNFQLKCAEA